MPFSVNSVIKEAHEDETITAQKARQIAVIAGSDPRSLFDLSHNKAYEITDKDEIIDNILAESSVTVENAAHWIPAGIRNAVGGDTNALIGLGVIGLGALGYKHADKLGIGNQRNSGNSTDTSELTTQDGKTFVTNKTYRDRNMAKDIVASGGPKHYMEKKVQRQTQIIRDKNGKINWEKTQAKENVDRDNEAFDKYLKTSHDPATQSANPYLNNPILHDDQLQVTLRHNPKTGKLSGVKDHMNYGKGFNKGTTKEQRQARRAAMVKNLYGVDWKPGTSGTRFVPGNFKGTGFRGATNFSKHSTKQFMGPDTKTPSLPPPRPSKKGGGVEMPQFLKDAGKTISTTGGEYWSNLTSTKNPIDKGSLTAAGTTQVSTALVVSLLAMTVSSKMSKRSEIGKVLRDETDSVSDPVHEMHLTNSGRYNGCLKEDASLHKLFKNADKNNESIEEVRYRLLVEWKSSLFGDNVLNIKHLVRNDGSLRDTVEEIGNAIKFHYNSLGIFSRAGKSIANMFSSRRASSQSYLRPKTSKRGSRSGSHHSSRSHHSSKKSKHSSRSHHSSKRSR